MNQNTVLNGDDVAGRIAQRSLAKRSADYADEVRRLLDAAVAVMEGGGTASRARVADIVAAAGLSNDAFYRHFASKEALIAAILQDGAERTVAYLAHQLARESTPEGKIRRWVETLLAQTEGEIASRTLAVLHNSSTAAGGVAAGLQYASAPLAALLSAPFTELGSVAPELDASLVAHAVLGTVSDYLWQRRQPAGALVDEITAFCLSAVRRSS